MEKQKIHIIEFVELLSRTREMYSNEVDTRFVPVRYLALKQFSNFILNRIGLEDDESRNLIKEAISSQKYTYNNIIELMKKLKKKGVEFETDIWEDKKEETMTQSAVYFDDDGKLRYIPKETMQVVEDIIKQNNRWRAKKGGKYYFISSEGEIDCEYDDYDNVDNARYNFHNYFKTRHEAELKLNKLKED